LLTISTPSLTIQGAGDLSRVDTHWSRFLPSNRTMASDGGAPSVAPGVTTLGSGAQTSVSLGLPRRPLRAASCEAAGCCATSEAAAAPASARSAQSLENRRRESGKMCICEFYLRG